jgi:hypothetical protein
MKTTGRLRMSRAAQVLPSITPETAKRMVASQSA